MAYGLSIKIVALARLTAGSAKKLIAKIEKHDATIRPIHVWGTEKYQF